MSGQPGSQHEEQLARINLRSLKDVAGELQLGDPEAILRSLQVAQGAVTHLRAYARRRIADRETARVAGGT